MDNNVKTQVTQRVKEAQNILVTVSDNPSVDQLAAAIGLTLFLNKINKKATAVFSGEVPSTLEFLKPEETIEHNTDSLRDFIVSLDKSKADKLKYKVEDEVVKIFITPYKTSLSEDDLLFSQGDFNVDVVIALGVEQRDHIDKAIVSHGRILHDATVIGLMAGETPIDVGGMNWQEPSASSLCEMLVDLSNELGKDSIDKQIATAFMTGIVAETDRFSNPKTSPKVMSISADLMSRGANNQLISDELSAEPEEGLSDELPAPVEEQILEDTIDENGVLTLSHPVESQVNEEETQVPNPDEIKIDEHGNFYQPEDITAAVEDVQSSSQSFNDSDSDENSTSNNFEDDQFAKYLNSPPTMTSQPLNANLSSTTEEAEAQQRPISEVQTQTQPQSNIEIVSTDQMLNHDDSNIEPSSTPSTEEIISGDVENQVLTYEMTDKGVVSPLETTEDLGKTKVDPETARRLVEEAVEKNYDSNRPEPRKDLGATELGADFNTQNLPGANDFTTSSQGDSLSTSQPQVNMDSDLPNTVSPDTANFSDQPPAVPPPLPFPNQEQRPQINQNSARF